jgi:hypothetical protein
MSRHLTRDDLMSLETYSQQRPEYRQKVMQHKLNRRLEIGSNATLYFEDVLTMQYQIQEMLRVERIFDAAGINEELETYNALIPDGKNLKATFMLEFPEIEERKRRLTELKGIEDVVYLQVEGFDKVYPIADEDLERENEEKTSSVHFLRFEFHDEMISALKNNADLIAGIEHENYTEPQVKVALGIRDSLTKDFD